MSSRARRSRAPPVTSRGALGAYQRLVTYQQVARATGVGDEYLHLCRGTVLGYSWQTTTAPERFVCASCGAVGVCVACVEDQGRAAGRAWGAALVVGVTPVLCRRHGGLEADEGVALAVGPPQLALSPANRATRANTYEGAAPAAHHETVQQAPLFEAEP